MPPFGKRWTSSATALIVDCNEVRHPDQNCNCRGMLKHAAREFISCIMNTERSGKLEIVITPEMLEAGIAIYRRWELDVDYNDGRSALEPDADELVKAILSLVSKPSL